MWCMLMGHNHGEQHASQAATVTLRTCAHCGYPLQVNFAYCPNCSTSLRSAVCPSCGQAVDSTWNSCPFCGIALSTNAPAMAGHAYHE